MKINVVVQCGGALGNSVLLFIGRWWGRLDGAELGDLSAAIPVLLFYPRDAGL